MKRYRWIDTREPWLSLIFCLAAMALLALVLSGCASSGTLRGAQVALVGAQVADLHSTHQAIASGRGHEANPLFQTTLWRPTAAKAISTAAIFWMGRQGEKRGHGTLMAVVTAAGATAVAIIAGHNYSIAWGAP